MLLGRVWPSKEPAETYIIAIDFAKDLDVGETITDKTVTSARQDGTDSSGTFLTSPAISGTQVRVRVLGGVNGEVHRVQMRATTSNANVYEHEVDVAVEEA
jgi:hypothetical protein